MEYNSTLYKVGQLIKQAKYQQILLVFIVLVQQYLNEWMCCSLWYTEAKFLQ